MEYLVELNGYVRAGIAWIGHTEFLGVSLDIPAHILGGAIIYYLLAVRGWRPWLCLLAVIVLEGMKEAYDYSAVVHSRDYLEPVKDIAFTLLGAGIGHWLSREVDEKSKG